MLASIAEVTPGIEAVKNGMITSYYENGKKSAEGIKVGEWKYYNNSRTLIEKGSYAKNKKMDSGIFIIAMNYSNQLGGIKTEIKQVLGGFSIMMGAPCKGKFGKMEN